MAERSIAENNGFSSKEDMNTGFSSFPDSLDTAHENT
jgi:hypothetical protein